MNLSKEQIRELEAAFFEWIGHPGDVASGNTLENFLTEKFGAKEESWPRLHDVYTYLDDKGRLAHKIFNNHEEDLARLSIGNIYRTKEEAEAVCALRRHVHKFSVSSCIDVFYFLNLSSEKWERATDGDGWSWKQQSEYEQGTIMPLSSTKEDRAERIDLLKKCYS